MELLREELREELPLERLEEPTERLLEPEARLPEERPLRWASARSSNTMEALRVRNSRKKSLRSVMARILDADTSGVGDSSYECKCGAQGAQPLPKTA